MQIQIVPYQKQYAEAIANLIISIQQQEFNIKITLADQPDLQDIDNFYRKGSGNFWCALSPEGELIGTIALIDIGNNMGAIRKMFVKHEWRGKEKNVARLLLHTLETWAQQHAVSKLYLGTVEKLKAAQRFYEREGFTLVDVEALPTQFPRMAVDTIFYQKTLYSV
ncbi:GNAT family N-acetyltransferase [Ohtaekwangia kribbensis]|jgi:N-acetylglutamate synthase-like GNAT family acetyltransferase|uniref:GNAT family N-acetyltransferase n=1 Tax=Ohtaekwangia kribbensis TaxID=688913 RepID=A0ABW3JVW3_9BACT